MYLILGHYTLLKEGRSPLFQPNLNVVETESLPSPRLLFENNDAAWKVLTFAGEAFKNADRGAH